MKKFKKVCALFIVGVLLVSILATGVLAVNDDTVAVLRKSGGTETEYTSVNTALLLAASGDTVYVVKNTKLTGNVTVKTGVTLVIPTSSDYTADNTTTGHNVSGNGSAETAYATLEIPAATTLTVNGTLIVAGNQQSTQPRSGFLTGDYGAIDLQGDIVVNGTLYARGEISGTGKVTATSTGSVYERFQIADWRGGTASNKAKNNGVFPFDLYDLGGISANLVLNSGAQLYGQAFIVAASRNISMNIPVITYSGEVTTDEYKFEGSIISMSGTGGTVTFTTAANNVKTITVKDATLRTGNLSYSLKILGFEIFGFDSAGMDCPFGYHMNVVLDQGATMEVGTMLKIMPQCTFTVKNGAHLIITDGHKSNGDVVHGSMNFYGKDGFKKEYYFGTAATWTYTDPARLTVETGGEVEVGDANTISSTDQAFTNVDGFEAASDEATVPVLEWNQTADEKVTVWFYKGTPTPTTAA